MMRRLLTCSLSIVCWALLVAAQSTPTRVRVSEGVTQAMLTHKVSPVFPADLDPAIQDPVVLKAIIDKEGNVQSLQVIGGTPMLAPAAIDAVKQWKYQPYLLNGVPVEVETTVRVPFVTPGKPEPDQKTDGEERLKIPQDTAQPPLLLRKVAPMYPPLARQARIQGRVVLSIVINRDGEVRDTKLVSGHPMLAPAAIEAVKQWKYKPYISGDQPVEVDTVVRVNFKLADGPDKSPAPETAPQESSAAGGMQGRARVSSGVMQGMLENKVNPEYPAEAKEQHIQGTVVLSVNIDKEGNVARVELVSGNPLLAPAAMDAVLQWKYRPFLLNSEAVAVETTVQVKFALAE